jgi:hypothetical protein
MENPTPELVALLETELAMWQHSARKHNYRSYAEEEAHHEEMGADTDRRWRVWEAILALPSQSVADLALKARAAVRIYEECDKEDVFNALVADIERLAGGAS